jgi:hypothetical protein
VRLNIFYAAAALIAAAGSPAWAQEGGAWQLEDKSGPATHRASAVTLPAELEGFQRTRTAEVGPEDVAASFSRKDGKTETTATVYLFRPGTLPEHRLKGSVASFGKMSPIAFLWSAGPFDIPAAPPLHGYKGVFKTGVGPKSVMDYLYFVEMGRWTAKVRATVTGIKEPEQEARIDAFVRALPWGQILAANGECKGTACTTPTFERFRHHIMETTLGPLMAMKMEFDPKAEAALPVVGKADVPLFGAAEIRRSDTAELRYVAAVPKFFTYRVVPLPDAVKPLFTDGFGKLSATKPLYALVIKVGKDGLTPRLYSGEPSVEAFAKAVEELALEKMDAPMLSVSDYAEQLPE